MKIKKDAITPEQSAMLHLIKGTLEALKVEAPVGHTKLENRKLTFTTGKDASVTREEGNAGQGFNFDDPKPLEVSKDALLLYIERMSVYLASTAQKDVVTIQVWQSCIADAERGMKGALPNAAAIALEEYAKTLPIPVEKPKTRTSGKRAGAKDVEIELKRLPKVQPSKWAGKKSA